MIIVIDDDVNVRETVCEILKLEFKTEVASFTGVPVFLTHKPERIDLIISDILMPDGSGLILEEKLPPDVLLVYLSGHADQTSGTSKLILRKPVQQEKLFQTARELIAGK